MMRIRQHVCPFSAPVFILKTDGVNNKFVLITLQETPVVA